MFCLEHLRCLINDTPIRRHHHRPGLLGEALAGLAQVAHQRPEHAPVPLHHLLLLVDLLVCRVCDDVHMFLFE